MRQIIGALIVFSPAISVLVLIGIFTTWWMPFAIVGFAALMVGLAILGVYIATYDRGGLWR